jgi:hypothetical protein
MRPPVTTCGSPQGVGLNVAWQSLCHPHAAADRVAAGFSLEFVVNLAGEPFTVCVTFRAAR